MFISLLFFALFNIATGCLNSSGLCKCTVDAAFCTGKEGVLPRFALTPNPRILKIIVADSWVADTVFLLCGSGKEWASLQVVQFQNCVHNCGEIEGIKKCSTALVESTFCG